MIVAVVGLWHLGCVTAACLARAGHTVIGFDHDARTIAKLRQGSAPIAEPGLEAYLREHAARIEYTTDPAAAARAELAWITYDTPVDDDDRADTELVLAQVARLIPHLRDDAVVLVSSQLPVGSCKRIEALRAGLRVACSPENLRLGKAIQVFSEPDRVIVGVRDDVARARITTLLTPITSRIEWMSVESAEMTKHAINAFLAVSVTFANELATLCERVGADAKEVERGLKTESRIGPRAYLAPGGAFAGGTLARDVAFLAELGAGPLIASVRPSNAAHARWAIRKIEQRLGDARGHTIAIWGLTYKPGTDTLRRSMAIETGRALAAAGARVVAWDPAVRTLPDELAHEITLAPSAEAALRDASVLVVATPWPELARIELAASIATMRRRLVLDADRFLAKPFGKLEVEYVAVGVPDHG